MKIHSGPASFPSTTADNGIIILGTISEGRMFRVLKAQQGTKFVILKVPLQNDSMSLAMLRREYEMSKNLNHPCIASTLEFNENIPAIVTEYIEGLTLDEYVASKPTLAQRKSLLGDILDAMDYLHHRGVLHNDLKPDNILVTPGGAARIIDFGLSGSDDSVYKGCVGGSDGYTAPEVLEGKGNAGAASDIFSLGVLINLIFGGARYGSIARKCSQKDPESRYQNVKSVRRAIARRDRLPIILTAAAVLAVILALILQPRISAAGVEERYERVEEQISDEMSASFHVAFDGMSAQQYQEFAAFVYQDWFMLAQHYLDSLQKAHPIKGDGVIPPEINAASKIITGQIAALDSIRRSKPSITTLPAEEQGALIQLINK